MDRVDHLRALVSVIEHGGLTAAGRQLNRSLQSISRSLAAVEQDVGVELVRRTTRRSDPTEAGLAYYHRVKPALEALDDARLAAAGWSAEVTGLLRIAAPVLFAPTYLVPVLTSFMQAHPRVDVDLKLSDSFVDLAGEGIDLAVRLGELPDSALKAKRLGKLRRVVFGAPAYFAEHGYPTHPRDLEHHQCIVRVNDPPGDRWPFQLNGGISHVKVGGRFRADHTSSTYAAVAQGIGLGFSPLWQIRDLVDRGRVEPILVDYEAPAIPVHLVWHHSRLPLAKTRRLIDFLSENMRCEDR